MGLSGDGSKVGEKAEPDGASWSPCLACAPALGPPVPGLAHLIGTPSLSHSTANSSPRPSRVGLELSAIFFATAGMTTSSQLAFFGGVKELSGGTRCAATPAMREVGAEEVDDDRALCDAEREVEDESALEGPGPVALRFGTLPALDDG
jgi:hypothetical protein